MILGSLIKWWGPLLVLPLLGARQYKKVFAALMTAVVLHLVLISLLPYGTFFSRVSRHLQVMSDSGYANFISHNSVSTPAMIGRISCWLDPTTVCGLEGQLAMESIPVGRIGQLSSIAFVLLAVLGALWRTGSRDPVVLSLVGCLSFLVVPEAQAYNMVGASAAALFMFWWLNSTADGGKALEASSDLYGGLTARSFAFALALSTVPLPWFNFRDVQLGLPLWVPGLEFFRVQFLVGATWLPVLLLVLYDRVRCRSRSRMVQ